MKKLMNVLIVVSALVFGVVAFAQNEDGKAKPGDKNDIPVAGATAAIADCPQGSCLAHVSNSQVDGRARIQKEDPNAYSQMLPDGGAQPAKPAQPAKGVDGTN